MTRFGIIVLGLFAIAIACAGLVRAYEFWAGRAQDQCSFGTVSNERYREWLFKAKKLREREGQLLDDHYVTVKSSGHVERANNLRFDELSRGVTSIDERIAIVHAMMRADGFRLRAVIPDSLQPFEGATTAVSFRYRKCALAGLLFACAFGCEHRAFATFFLRSRNQPPLPNDRDLPNQFDLAAYFEPNLQGGAWAPSRPEIVSPTCPPVPSLAWTMKFQDSLKH